MEIKRLPLSENYQTKETEFYSSVKTEFGSRGVREAKALLQGDYENMCADEKMNAFDCEAVLLALQEVFIKSKREARLKYTPHKYRNSQ